MLVLCTSNLCGFTNAQSPPHPPWRAFVIPLHWWGNPTSGSKPTDSRSRPPAKPDTNPDSLALGPWPLIAHVASIRMTFIFHCENVAMSWSAWTVESFCFPSRNPTGCVFGSLFLFSQSWNQTIGKKTRYLSRPGFSFFWLWILRKGDHTPLSGTGSQVPHPSPSHLCLPCATEPGHTPTTRVDATHTLNVLCILLKIPTLTNSKEHY